MRLLFDQNLSFKLIEILADDYPESGQVRLLGMAQASDKDIWRYAKANDWVIVSHDVDFAEMAALYGPPPQVIWLRCGNQPTVKIADMLRAARADIERLSTDPDIGCLEIYG